MKSGRKNGCIIWVKWGRNGDREEWVKKVKKLEDSHKLWVYCTHLCPLFSTLPFLLRCLLKSKPVTPLTNFLRTPHGGAMKTLSYTCRIRIVYASNTNVVRIGYVSDLYRMSQIRIVYASDSYRTRVVYVSGICRRYILYAMYMYRIRVESGCLGI